MPALIATEQIRCGGEMRSRNKHVARQQSSAWRGVMRSGKFQWIEIAMDSVRERHPHALYTMAQALLDCSVQSSRCGCTGHGVRKGSIERHDRCGAGADRS